MSLSKRLFTYIRAKGVTINKFEKGIGVSQGLLAKAIKNESVIGSDKLEKIFLYYGDINLNWLITGKGSMFLEEGRKREYQENNREPLVSERDTEKLAVIKNNQIRQDKLTDDLLKSKDTIIKLNRQLADLRFLVAKSGLSDQIEDIS